MRCILYTAYDGCAHVCTPSSAAIEWLGQGGRWRGHGIDLDEQVERQVADGIREHAARRFVRAMDKGGCTTAEAYDIIRDRDCGHRGTAFELIDTRDLPDRWFRDAWRRGHNGGPVDLDMDAARDIQFCRIRAAVARMRVARVQSLKTYGKPLRIRMGVIADRIRKADCPDDLRRIWPEGVNS